MAIVRSRGELDRKGVEIKTSARLTDKGNRGKVLNRSWSGIPAVIKQPFSMEAAYACDNRMRWGVVNLMRFAG